MDKGFVYRGAHFSRIGVHFEKGLKLVAACSLVFHRAPYLLFEINLLKTVSRGSGGMDKGSA